MKGQPDVILLGVSATRSSYLQVIILGTPLPVYFGRAKTIVNDVNGAEDKTVFHVRAVISSRPTLLELIESIFVDFMLLCVVCCIAGKRNTRVVYIR